MALIKCKECNEQISDKASSCPKCGAPVNTRRKGPSGCMMVFLIALGVTGMLVWISSLDSHNKIESTVLASKEEANQITQEQSKNETVLPSNIHEENWHSQTEENGISGKKEYYLINVSTNSVDFDFPYNEPGGSRLKIILRDSDEGNDAYIVISNGQIKCGYSDCSIRTRGDNGKVRTWKSSPEASGKSNMIFINDVSGFKKYLKANKNLVVGVTFYRAGEHGFNFEVSDLPDVKK